MIREEIEKTNKGYLVDITGQQNLLVSFGGIKQGLGIPVFEFFNSIADIPCDKIFLRDFNQAWYQKGVDEEIDHIDKLIADLKEKIASNQYKRICFLGNSMGGYGAILFGSLLNVDKVLAFAPQTFIDRINRFVNFDRRWHKQISQIYSFGKKRKEFFDLRKHLSATSDYKTEIHIYYSPLEKLDRKHAERLREAKNVNLHPINEGGHSVVKAIRGTGELKTLIQSTFEDSVSNFKP